LKLSDYGVEITRVHNGYVCRYPSSNDVREFFETEVFSDDDADELASGEDLLNWIIDFFGIGGSRHDAARLGIAREPGDKYEGPETGGKETE
jgi:hypothetical protein